MSPTPNVVIVPSHDEDIPAISGIYARHLRDGLALFETEMPTLKEMRRRRLELRSNGFPYLVAFQDDVLAGYAYAGPCRERRAYRFAVEDFICLDPAFAGRGVDRALLDALIHESEVRGFRQMMAVIGDRANHANRASIRLHQRCGFAVVGTLCPAGRRAAARPIPC